MIDVRENPVARVTETLRGLVSGLGTLATNAESHLDTLQAIRMLGIALPPAQSEELRALIHWQAEFIAAIDELVECAELPRLKRVTEALQRLQQEG